MNEETAHHVAAVMFLAPAIVWGILARQFWAWMTLRGFRDADARLSGAMAALIALVFGLGVVRQLLPHALVVRSSVVGMRMIALQDIAWVSVVAVFRHSARYASVIREPMPRGWLLVNYLAWAIAGAIIVVGDLGGIPAGRGWTLAVLAVLLAYMLGMTGLAIRSLVRHARHGAWQAAGVGEPRYLDGILLMIGTACIVASLAVACVRRDLPDHVLTAGTPWAIVTVAGLQALAGLVFATPLVARLLGTVIHQLLVAVTVTTMATLAYFGGRALGDRVADGGGRLLIDAGTIGVLIALLGSGRALVTDGIDWLVFRRSRQRRLELDTRMRAITPELGVVECCRRAAQIVMEVIGLRGAAILLQSGEIVVHGHVEVAPLVAGWPRGARAETLPTQVSLADEIGIGAPALLDTLIAADVALVVPIASGDRRWGDLFLSADLMRGTPLTIEQADAWDGFAAQLGRVLDGADILARAVAVERSLAHAEKLAAIGEMAARIAHEIRNPVTAARSLAQQLARDSASPDAEPARLILSELERVERQVAALLRFSRRDDFCFAPVDLAALVRGAMQALAPRLETAGIDVALDLTDGITARADAEKLRQVLVNLVENAVDALRESPRRVLAVAVSSMNGHATLAVRDTGPGVSTDVLPHLFEPFFSQKAHGTGLGLAIAKRIVDAHGGRIAAHTSEAGMAFEIELPLRGT